MFPSSRNKKLDSLLNVIRLGADWGSAIHFVHDDKEFVVMNVSVMRMRVSF